MIGEIMGDSIKFCCGCIFLIFLIFGVFSLISNVHWTTDNLDAEDIYLDEFDSGIIQDGDTKRCMYHVYYVLRNVSTSFEDSKLITYYYNGNNVVTSDELYHFSNNTTETISYDELKDYNFAVVSTFLHLDNITNITHVVIVVMKDENVIFNTTAPFNMSNYEVKYYSSSNHENYSNNTADTTKNSATAHTYVASVNSNKFHESSCSQAHRIKDSNRITFSTRDEAINAGYSPCSICNP